MKIAHLLSNLSYGGAEQQVLSLCAELNIAGHDIRVASMKSGGELAGSFQQYQLREFEMKGAWDTRPYFRIKKWLRLERPDILHTHLFKADVFGAFAAGFNVPKIVSTKWNQDPYLKNPIFAAICRKAAKRCHSLIAVSEAVRDHLVRMTGIPSSIIEVIPVGIASEQPEVRSADPHKFRIGMVARLVEAKGHRILFDALHSIRQRITGWEVFLFGSGPLENELRRIVESLAMHDVIHFKGLVLDKQKIYESLDLLVLPSLWEGAPVVLPEAMSHGIPIVASTAGGIPEIVSADCGLLVQPGDANALAAALIQMAEDRQKRVAMSECCKKRAHDFSLKRMVERHIALYERILADESHLATAGI
jgi:glycosyltransferase involved in cell wall biosynthesis